MTLLYELIEAKTMVPVFLVHFQQRQRTPHQSLVGMGHSMVSYLMHLSFWWLEQNNVTIRFVLYVADKCFILAMVWGFHYHFDTCSAKIMLVPVVWDMYHILAYQYDYFLQTRFAYFDIFLLAYTACVFVWIIHLLRVYQKWTGILLLALSIIGYGLEIHGLMHVMLAPSFWICYEEIHNRKKICRQ